MYLDSATQLNRQLTMHHTIEEMHIFPVLGKKMPEFALHDHGDAHDSDAHEGTGEAEEQGGVHIASHRGIHKVCSWSLPVSGSV